MSKKIVIGSRESKLAVIQSEIVKNWIEEKHPDIQVEILTMKTTGDKILNKTLDKIGGKGLFVKELDKALLDGRSDLSVHSLKDMPMEVPENLPLIGFSERKDMRDVLVLPEGEKELDLSKPVGCSSKRRMLQFMELYPDVSFKMIRGNVPTRLAKLDAGEYGAIILAAAGLKRLGLENRISRYFSPDEMLPSAGQGILAIQGKTEQDYTYLEGFVDQDSALAATSERAFVKVLDGGCSSPIAAYAKVMSKQIFLTGLYYDEDTGFWTKGTLAGSKDQPYELGEELALKLKNRVDQYIASHEGECPPEKNGIKTQRIYPSDMGKVFLVGAGPGDAGLMTIKGKELISKADVIVYDSLVGDAILSMIPETAKTINVGKRAGNHIKSQYETNRILLEEAEKGNMVVRLKGGDPFMFGRGGEELELLAANEIPYEVVPGITSPIAVPAYNGIPVTHRDYCSSLHIITGHKREGKPLEYDFDALVRTEGTLVFLMGLNALEDICKGLLQAGMDPDMPAAVLQEGTTAHQRKVLATVSTLKEASDQANMQTPAIIMIGKVCSLADQFGWYEKLPLAGKKIAVTRPRDLVSDMAGRLRRLGAEVLELPAIATEPIGDSADLKEAIANIEDYQWLVFTSPTGVKVFFNAMDQAGCDVRHLGKIKVASIGKGSARELKKRGILPDLIPEIFDGKHLGEALAKTCQENSRILIPRAEIGNHEIIEELSVREDLQITDIATYQTLYTKTPVLDEKALFEAGKMDYAVFTSASTVRGFVAATQGLDYSQVTALCIGKQTAAEARKHGMTCHISKEASMDSLLELALVLESKIR